MDEDELEYEDSPAAVALSWRAIAATSMASVKGLLEVAADWADGISWLMLADTLHHHQLRDKQDAKSEAERMLSALDEL